MLILQDSGRKMVLDIFKNPFVIFCLVISCPEFNLTVGTVQWMCLDFFCIIFSGSTQSIVSSSFAEVFRLSFNFKTFEIVGGFNL